MPFTSGYSLKFDNVEGSRIAVYIYDRETYVAAARQTDFVRLEGAGVSISTVNNAEDKFPTIRGKQATIKFLSANNANLNSFLGGADDRWYVEIQIEEDLDPEEAVDPDLVIFKGHIVQDDISQEFLDDSTSCEVTLVATDGLGLLKETPLLNASDENPTGYNKIIEYIAWCLSPVGYDFNIYVANNIMGEDTPGTPFYESHYLHAKTFEDEIGTCEDCYSVLEKILGEDSFIVQHEGNFWIMRIDEIDINNIYTHLFDSDGVFQSSQDPETYGMNIGAGLSIHFSQQRTDVLGRRGLKSVREDYDYTYPLEIVDNIDFSRGDIYSVIAVSGGTAYYVDDWDLHEQPVGTPAATRTTAYIVRKFTDEYEKERYLVINPSPELSGSESINFLESNAIPVHQNDKFNISVDARYNIGYTGTETRPFMSVRLVADDGTYYWLGSDSGGVQWFSTNAAFTNNEVKINQAALACDGVEWVTYSYDAPPIPKDGNLYIQLWEANWEDSTSDDNVDIHYQNLTFEYIPHINGSYQKYSGQYTKVYGSTETKAKREKAVYISDSPKKLFKGAIFKDGTWTLIDETTVKFGPGNTIQIAGGVLADYPAGAFVKFIGITANTNPFSVASSSEAGGIVTLNVLQTVTDESAAGFNNHAVYKFVSGTYTLADGFYAGNVYPSGLPAADSIHPYGHLQAYSVWNQYNRVMRVFDATLQGLQTDTNLVPDLINMFTIVAISPHTTSKYFILLHYEMDLFSCEWRGTFAEVYDTVIGKTYADTKEFKYISDKTV